MPTPRVRPPLALLLLAAAAAGARAAAAAGAHADDYYVTAEEYYSMPQLFALDEYEGCMATRGAYCVGSFELAPAPAHDDHHVYSIMQRYSANWVDNFNHTRLHRGLCLTRSCAPAAPYDPDGVGTQLDTWFSSCVNASTMSSYNLTARPLKLEYCVRGAGEGEGEGEARDEGLSAGARGLAGLAAALLALAAVCTVLDLTLSDHAKKGAGWAVTWSLVGSWRALQAPPPRSQRSDLRAFDGLRVFCMMCVVIEHVGWLGTQSYVANTREYEQMRRSTDGMLMVNSTLVVQIFFLMSSFLLAHKVLQQRRNQERLPGIASYADTMLNRLVRVSPSYFFMVWFAASWWERMGRGPLWAPAVGAEAAVCRRKWWTHLLYLNNVLDADDKCLIQTWYLAADMQLYAASLALTMVLLRWRRGALYVLATLFVTTIAAVFGMAYAWNLVPTYVMHRPELVRQIYSGESSFNVLYQSPLSNAPGALAGLLLAHLHHALLDRDVRLSDYKVFRWVSIASPPLAAWWAAASPMLLGVGPPARGPAAALAALERPIFSLFVAMGLLGAMHDVKSPLRTVLSWDGWATPARLSFGVLLLHLPLNKSFVAGRLVMSQFTRQTVILEWFGVALASYFLALPLALLVELPAARLYRVLVGPETRTTSPPAPPRLSDGASLAPHEKTDM